LKWQQVVIGAITVARELGEDPFTQEDANFLEQIAAQAAIAIHQATLFEEVQDAHKRLQVLAHSLIDAQEAERKKLARELHDRIGQALTAVQINLQGVTSSSEGAYRLAESLTIVEDTLKQAHDLSLELRPSLLDDLGLVAALRWYVDRLANRSKLLRCFNADLLDTRLAPEIETACFRIAQEALTNVTRHAQATTIWVQLKAGDSDLQLIIKDDGKGFHVRKVLSLNGPNMSLGLQGMRERASALGGSVEIMSAPGQGTKVRTTFPLKDATTSYDTGDET
jgi:signal transduction histidine kinase